ncbi:hypothetical protein LOY85_09310 [Brevibacillus brevis]|uniref:hypothetical protein n=1 Tax=Brevibacillus brevis TaxID=1393 RepID=UPI001F210F88|nr:hypothetical protein [Brevibacillus brevis]UIO44331.1 hypothetical protein LOY85_09310 [Brevibacillus brevis]
MSIFKRVTKDIINLIKADGTVVENIRAHVQTETILIDDPSVPLEEGDSLTRCLSNGLTESYLVLDRGFYERVASVPAH